MKKEREYVVDLKKILIEVIRYWWICLLLAFFLGALLGGIKYAYDKKENKIKLQKLKIQQEKQEETESLVSIEQRIKEAKAELSAEEVINVELAIEYYKQIQQYKKYKNSSLYISLNPYNVNVTTLYFVVELDESVQGELEKQLLIDNITVAYSNYVKNGEFAKELSTEFGVEDRYLSELISITNNVSSNDTKNYINITIVNVDGLENLPQEVEKSVRNYSEQLNSSLGKHKLNLVDTYNNTEVDTGILSDVQSVQLDIYNASNRLGTLKKNFTEDQLIVYNQAIGVVDIIEAEDEESKDNTDTLEIKGAIKPAKLNILYVLLGIIVGVALYCGAIIFKIVFSKYVISMSGICLGYGLRHYGIIFAKEHFSKTFLKKIEYGELLNISQEEAIQRVAANIMLTCKNKNKDKIALVSSDFENINFDIVEKIKKGLEDFGITAIVLKNVLDDSKGILELFEVGECVLVEKTEKTQIKKVDEFINICYENEINLYGMVDIID